MRLSIVCCVAGAALIAAGAGAAAMEPAPLSSETLMMLAQAKPGVQPQQQILREPDLQQQIIDDLRFEGLTRDPQMQRLMQNPQLQRQLQQNQQLRQMYQLQHRPLPGVTADDDD
jgi:hypothetical protein